jgi:hypothetical protein
MPSEYRNTRLRSGGCWNVPGDPSRGAIAASDGLEGRGGGAARFWGKKKGRPRRAARTGLGEKLADVFGVCVVQIQLGAVLKQFGE